MITLEAKEKLEEEYFANQPTIGRHLRLKVIDWLFEIMTKFKITERAVMFQAISMMDKFYAHSKTNMPLQDLQLTAVTCFFMSAKNIMINPFNLQTVLESMCYHKFTHSQLIEKESAIRQSCDYVAESTSMIDFTQLYIKMIKYEFWKYLKQYKGYEPTKICKGTARFLKELEIISYELCKISLADVYVKRYLPSYVGAAFIITAFEVLVEDVMKVEGNATVLDLNHVVEYHRIIQNLFTKLFGYDKFVMF